MGFRWELDDDEAGAYAEWFYQKLFEVHRSLEDAFLDARRCMNRDERYAQKRNWAAPMLIMQLSRTDYSSSGTVHSARGHLPINGNTLPQN